PLEGVSLFENWVTPGYFATVGIPLAGGREFAEHDTAQAAKVAVVNETIVRRYFAGQSPIGRRLGFSQLNIEIVGVVHDARTQTLHDLPVPMVYSPLAQKSASLSTSPTNVDVRVAGDPAAAVPSIRDAVRRSEPGLMIGGIGPMSARLSRDLVRERIIAA